MTIHLIKLAVGVENLEHLRALQEARRHQARESDASATLRHITWHTPKRTAELLDGGSIYWVIKGFVRARQRLIGIEPASGAEGPRCALVLNPWLVATELRACRAFQGWRYLRPQDAPPDADSRNPASSDLPEAMAAELKALGLL